MPSPSNWGGSGWVWVWLWVWVWVWVSSSFYFLRIEASSVQTFFSCLYLHDLEKYGKAMPAFGAFADAFGQLDQSMKLLLEDCISPT